MNTIKTKIGDGFFDYNSSNQSNLSIYMNESNLSSYKTKPSVQLPSLINKDEVTSTLIPQTYNSTFDTNYSSITSTHSTFKNALIHQHQQKPLLRQSIESGKKIYKIRWLQTQIQDGTFRSRNQLSSQNFVTGSWGEVDNEVSIWESTVFDDSNSIGTAHGSRNSERLSMEKVASISMKPNVTDLLVGTAGNSMVFSTSAGEVRMCEYVPELKEITAVATKELHKTLLTNRSCPATGLALGDSIISVGESGSIFELSTRNLELIRSLEHCDEISLYCVNFTTGKTIVTGNSAGQIKSWDLRVNRKVPMQVLNHFEDTSATSCLAVHPTQSHILIGGYTSGGLDVWDLRGSSSNEPIATIQQQSGCIKEIFFHPIYPDSFFTSSDSCEVIQWFTGDASNADADLITRAPADIWSLGCTIVEMATGKPPFIELGSPEAAMFKVGFYKMHPQIPSEMSDRAKKFILRCFEPDPTNRSTAASLLEDPFLTESGRKKNIRTTASQEFARSISVPADRVSSVDKSRRQAFSNDDCISPKKSPSNINTVGSSQVSQSFGSGSSTATNSSSLSFASTNTNISEYDETQSRRGSGLGTSNVPVSPETDGPKSSPLHDGENAEPDFYLLKKESQRRSTLTRVLIQDERKICEIWMRNFERDAFGGGGTIIKREHIYVLMNGLRDYIESNDKRKIEAVINTLKEELSTSDPSTVQTQLQSAVLLFRDAVNTVLRSHNIKPHWMFALDSLLTCAIQLAIHMLFPEQVRGSSGGNGTGAGGGSDGIGSANSAISTINSIKSHKAVLEFPSPASAAVAKIHSEYQEQFEQLREENARLMKDLLESQKSYQSLLRSTLEEQCLHVRVLNQSTQQLRVLGQLLAMNPSASILRSSDTGFSSHHTLNSDLDEIGSQACGISTSSGDLQVPTEQEQIGGSNVSGTNSVGPTWLQLPSHCTGRDSSSSSSVNPSASLMNVRDPKLIEFLTEMHLDRSAIEKFLQEEYTYEDVIHFLSREDLKTLKLKGGVELRIWKAIQKLRDPNSVTFDTTTAE